MNTKRKILFLVTQSEFGGAQRFIYTLIEGLYQRVSAIDYEVVVGAGPEGDDEKGLLSLLERERIDTRHLKYLRRSVNPFFDFFLGLIEIYKLIKKEKPDILFLCSSKAGAMGSLIGCLAGVKKIIYRIGGWAFNDPRSFLSKSYYKFIERISAKWKDIIINNAESDKQQAIKLGIKPRGKILTVYNGIDVDVLEFYSKEQARKKILNTSYELRDTILGTIANLYPSKGLEYLIEAAKLLKDRQAKFIIIGEGQERKKLEKLIKKYNLENQFFLIGPIPEAYRYLKMFDIFVLSSIKEGFPWTILEAMAAEVPVIATKVGAVPEVIDPSSSSGQVGILVEPRNPKQLVEAIGRLIEDEDLRKKFAKEAHKVVMENFNLNRMVREVERLL